MKPTVRLLFCVVAPTLLALSAHPGARAAPTLTVLHAFTGSGADGAYSSAGLIQGSDGGFYGTTRGSADFDDKIFRVTSAGEYAILYSFGGNDSPGGNDPRAALVEGSDGNFYGTARIGGSHYDGTVFRMTPAGDFSVLHTFTDTGTDGDEPIAALIQGSDGNFYGTTQYGGDTNQDGTVFRITPAGTYTTLYSFTESDTDGYQPASSLVQGKDGNFYGTTSNGFTNEGTVFKITPAGARTTLHVFGASHPDGDEPLAGLIQASDGNFYGTTFSGGGDGVNNEGTVFRITPAGEYTILHSFVRDTEGSSPYASLVQGRDGNFYGTTSSGGSDDNGTIFRMTPAGECTVLHHLTALDDDGDNADGAGPRAPLAQGSDGNFYGTAFFGGSSGAGTVFRLNVSPVITSAKTTVAMEGRAFSYQIKATNDPVRFGVTGLPPGLKVDAASGVISGTPGAEGRHTLTLKATNALGTGTAPLVLTIASNQPPVITSPATAAAQVGRAFSYRVRATHYPTGYGVVGLPAGLHVDAATGLVSGTPEKAGKFRLTLKAVNGVGTGMKMLDLTVEEILPQITSAGTASGTVGVAFSYRITASHHPTGFGALGLRSGLVVDAKTGIISGTPTASGTFKLTIKATNSAGAGEKTLTVTIKPG